MGDGRGRNTVLLLRCASLGDVNLYGWRHCGYTHRRGLEVLAQLLAAAARHDAHRVERLAREVVQQRQHLVAGRDGQRAAALRRQRAVVVEEEAPVAFLV